MLSKLRRSLAVRLVLFLSLALIPVGLLAGMQTASIVQKADERANDLLVGLTQEAALAEREIIQRAFGMSVGLIPLATDTWEESVQCEQRLASFVETQDTAITVGVIRKDGHTLCTSNGIRYDFKDLPEWRAAVADPRAFVEVSANAPISRRPVIVIMQPVYREARFAGFVFVSVPLELFDFQSAEPSQEDFTVIAFTANGQFLTGSGQNDETSVDVLPQTRSLASLVGSETTTFRERRASGDMRSFAVVPIFDDTVYALGTWQRTSIAAGGVLAIPPQFFPVIMWLASLGVAFVAIHRLVTRHIRRLRRQMRAFADSRTVPDGLESSNASAVITDIHHSFEGMVHKVLRDEAALEQLLHDKSVLLREVHHRVTNNLQLTISIMNMQMREVKSPEAKAVVQRLQDRVLGLATIHRNLYRTENLSKVHAALMLTEITDQILSLGQGADGSIAFDSQLEDVTLYPDQAVPLSLLVAEATTNALKYMGHADAEKWLRLVLKVAETGEISVEIANGIAPAASLTVSGDAHLGGTGLGTNLMRAFATQLNGRIEFDGDETSYTVRVRFTRAGFDPGDEDNGTAAASP